MFLFSIFYLVTKLSRNWRNKNNPCYPLNFTVMLKIKAKEIDHVNTFLGQSFKEHIFIFLPSNTTKII